MGSLFSIPAFAASFVLGIRNSTKIQVYAFLFAIDSNDNIAIAENSTPLELHCDYGLATAQICLH